MIIISDHSSELKGFTGVDYGLSELINKDKKTLVRTVPIAG